MAKDQDSTLDKSVSEHQQNADDLSTPLKFEERLSHFAKGYDNSQSVVRFLDTKAAATIGAVPIVLGILAGIFNWLQQFWGWKNVLDLLGIAGVLVFAAAGLVLIVLILIFAWQTLHQAFRAITPRDIGDSGPTVLFPYETPEKAKEPFPARVEVFAGTPKRSDTIEDYRRQLIRMSQIVAKKLQHVNRAISNLTRLFVVAFLTLVFLLAFTLALAGNALSHSYRRDQNRSSQHLPPSNVPTTVPTGRLHGA